MGAGWARSLPLWRYAAFAWCEHARPSAPKQDNMTRQLATMLSSLSVISCSASDRSPTFSVRDSAGIAIIESRSPVWDSAASWYVDSMPDFRLSEQQDDNLFQIGTPRSTSNGHVVFLNRGACEVRYHDSAGKLIARSGRCGKGPGEFDEPSGLWPWLADSVIVIDQLTRVTVLTPDGSLGRITLLPQNDSMPIPFIRGVLSDGTLVLVGLRNPGGRASPGIERGRSTLAVLRGLENSPQLIASYPGPIFEYTQLGDRLGRGRLAFSSSTDFAAGASSIYVGFPDRYEIHVHDGAGKLLRILRRAFDTARVEPRDIDWLLQRRLGQVQGADNQRAVRQAFRELQHAELMPAFGPPVWPGGSEGGPAMLVDLAGNLWVFDHYRPGEYRNHWSVFSSAGAWLGTVKLPPRLTPSQIGSDYVIGTWTDETGFVHIQRHRLVRP